MAGQEQMEQALRNWVREHTGQAVSEWAAVPGGASRLSYAVVTADGGRYFLRVDSGSGPLSGTRYDLEREQRVISALHRQGFPVPAIYGWSAELRAILMEHVPGSSGPEGLERISLQHALIEQVAKLQTVPMDHAVFPDLPDDSVGAAVEAELELWNGLYLERATQPEPVIALALRWLAKAIPNREEPAVWVHGDIGPGNFLFTEAAVTALIDWELAHPGHPLEDLACIIARSLGAPFGDNRRHLEAFERYRGRPVDRVALDYCVVLVLTRFCIGIQMALSNPSVSLDIPTLVLFRQLNLQALAGLLAAKHGVEVRPLALQANAAGEFGGWFAYMSETMNGLLAPALTENRFLSHRLRGLTALNTWLEDVAVYGYDRYVREECDQVHELLGRRQNELTRARHSVCDAIADLSATDTIRCIRYLVWRCQRDHQLMARALGSLAERRLAY